MSAADLGESIRRSHGGRLGYFASRSLTACDRLTAWILVTVDALGIENVVHAMRVGGADVAPIRDGPPSIVGRSKPVSSPASVAVPERCDVTVVKHQRENRTPTPTCVFFIEFGTVACHLTLLQKMT